MGEMELDTADYPLVRLRPATVCDEAGARELIASFEAVLDRAEAEDSRFIMVADSRNVDKITSLFRRDYAAWENTLSDERYGRMALRVVILDSAIVRGAITAMSWFSPRMKSIVAVANIDEAVKTVEAFVVNEDFALARGQIEGLRTALEALRAATA